MQQTGKKKQDHEISTTADLQSSSHIHPDYVPITPAQSIWPLFVPPTFPIRSDHEQVLF